MSTASLAKRTTVPGRRGRGALLQLPVRALDALGVHQGGQAVGVELGLIDLLCGVGHLQCVTGASRWLS